MDQAELRRLEARCIQEEPPQCRAACPLHVDARAVCDNIAAGKVDAAWAALCRTMPLPGVLARTCSAPCSAACLRAPLGGGIEMGALERFCAENARKSPPLRPMPARGVRVGILGATLPGLAAAWDLGRKGFTVVIHCQSPDDMLSAHPHLPQIDPDILHREIATLAKMGVTFHKGAQPTPDTVAAISGDVDFIFADPLVCPADCLGIPAPDPATLTTATPGLFAAMRPDDNGGALSAAALAAIGRKAALSIERTAQKASISEGRDREDPYTSPLYTNTEGVAPAPAVPVPAEGYDADAATQEARRCLQCECMECVKNCAYLRKFGSYPKVYARQVYNNASIVMGTRQANTLINSCMLCGLCTELCPEDFSMTDLCLDARRDMVQRDKMPPSAHEFALRDMDFASSESCALTAHQPGTQTSAFMYFPGCQLTASMPDAVRQSYRLLQDTLDGGVGLMLRCCGAPAEWGGRPERFAEVIATIRKQWEELGQPVIITACPTCTAMLTAALNGADIRSLWDVLAEHPDALPAPAQGTFALHDPCTARHNSAMQDSVRQLLERLGVTVTLPKLSGLLTECCGFGGLLADANAPLAATVAAERAQRLDGDAVTYCAMCRDLLAKAGKRCLHVFDLILPSGDDDPAARPAPTHSTRRENRVRLRESLLRELWDTDAAPRPAYESVAIRFTDEAAQRMEERRILLSDVQKTLFAAHASGKGLRNTTNGRLLAAHRPAVVTYWVEYEMDGDTAVVHNLWSHRMRIAGGTL